MLALRKRDMKQWRTIPLKKHLMAEVITMVDFLHKPQMEPIPQEETTKEKVEFLAEMHSPFLQFKNMKIAEAYQHRKRIEMILNDPIMKICFDVYLSAINNNIPKKYEDGETRKRIQALFSILRFLTIGKQNHSKKCHFNPQIVQLFTKTNEMREIQMNSMCETLVKFERPPQISSWQELDLTSFFGYDLPCASPFSPIDEVHFMLNFQQARQKSIDCAK
jgi:hypothetical protein